MKSLAILVYRDERLVAAHRLDGDVVKIGRDVTCEIQLVDDRVEHLHAALERTDEGWCVVDVEQGGEIVLHPAGASGIALDDPDAFSELRGEVCRTCGHLSLFVDPAAIVERD